MKQADNNKKNRHLTAQDRQEIMNGLDKGLSFKAIALLVQKDSYYHILRSEATSQRAPQCVRADGRTLPLARQGTLRLQRLPQAPFR